MSADTPAPAHVPPLRKKRMTVFDALDGALAKVKGLDEAAAKAKTLPFKLRSDPPLPYGVAPLAQPTNQTDKKSRQNEPTNSTVEINSPIKQLSSTDERTNQADKANSQVDKISTQTKHEIRADKPSIEDRQTKQTDKTDIQTDHQYITNKSSGQTAPIMRLPPRLPLTTAAQKTLASYFLGTGPIVTTYAVIAAETGVPMGTARTIIDKFCAAGWLRKEQWGAGRNRALTLAPTDALTEACASKQADKTQKQAQQTKYADKSSAQSQLLNQTVEINRGNALLKIDRKNLSISLETLHTSWPTLARAGFGLEQIEQIHAALAQLGKTTDRIVQGLDHAEWELAADKMFDKQGQPVADPCAWVYRSLASQGYYRRPVGYVSAQEQAECDAIEEAKALTRTRENARQERFRAWLQGLGVEERKSVMTGRLGPEEAWLKKEWAKRGEPS